MKPIIGSASCICLVLAVIAGASWTVLAIDTPASMKTMVAVFETFLEEARGKEDCLWSTCSGGTPYNETMMHQYHHKAGAIIWLLFDLSVSVRVVRLMEKAVVRASVKNAIKAQIEHSYDIDAEAFATIIDEFEFLLEMNSKNGFDKYKINSRKIEVLQKESAKNYMKRNLLVLWPHWSEDPKPNVALHLEIMRIATYDVDTKCFDNYGDVQNRVRVLFNIATNSDSSDFIKEITKNYHYCLYRAEDVLDEVEEALPAASKPTCITTKTGPQFDVNKLANNFLAMNMLNSATLNSRYNEELAKLSKMENPNPDYYQ